MAYCAITAFAVGPYSRRALHGAREIVRAYRPTDKFAQCNNSTNHL